MKKIRTVTACLQALLAIHSAQAADAPAAAAPPTVIADYHPSMADLMNIGIQPRHTKLGLAGQYKNWTYAAYELNELRNAFNRVAKTIPVFNSNDTAALIASMTQTPLADLDKAIGENLDAALIQNHLQKRVDYKVNNSVVTLSGEVHSQADRDAAQQIAAAVPNVRQVVNELQVKNQPATSQP